MLKKTSGRPPSLSSAVGTGTVLSILWTLGAAALGAKLLDAEVLKMEQVGYFSMVSLLIAGVLGAWIAGRKAGHRNAAAAGMSAGAYILCLLTVNALFFGASFTGVWADAVTVLAGTGVGMALKQRSRGGVKRRRYKIHKA